ncbi:MAG: hypothetical protein QGI79_04195 [Dehalococcoidia bacterium]|nr:hypothetical protein [Dehalococcoidia bacterium]
MPPWLVEVMLSLVIAAANIIGGGLAIFRRNIYGSMLTNFPWLTTGIFIHVAVSGLLPAAGRGPSRLAVVFVVAGMGLFYLSHRLVEMLV